MCRKYQPSNGTEGMSFIADHCEQCLHEKYTHTYNDSDKKCEILTDTMVYNINDKEYPEEWCYVDDKPTCTKWQKWDWGNDDDDNGLNEPPEQPVDDPNQLMLFSIADEVLENHTIKEKILEKV